jgi:hypothetical protein
MPEQPRLSIICTGRNDDRAPDQFERLISLQRTVDYALRRVPFEFLFVEWNPDPDRPYLGEALFLDQARHYVVTRDAHKRLIADAQLSTRDGKAVRGERAFLLNHANNVGLKHARGEWVLITNLDDLFPPQLGTFFETGESGALARGVHPAWSYRLLVVYRRAKRSAAWRRTRRASARLRRAATRLLSLPVRALRLGVRVARRCYRWGRSALHLARRAVREAIRVVASSARSVLRAILIRLLGDHPRPKRTRSPWWPRLRRLLLSSRLVQSVLSVARVVGGGFVFIGKMVGQGAAELHPAQLALRAARMRARVRRRAGIIAEATYMFLFAPRVDWQVRRVQLSPGTLYRLRRQHVSANFARRGADRIAIDDFIRQVELEATDGPWHNEFPWTWACGDFLLLDLATWKRIGGFPQQIGQLHADSVTMFRIVAESCPVVLLDWNIYHMDHDDRFDAVPYVEYDFENVHRYFGLGWTKAEVTLVDRSQRPFVWDTQWPATAPPVVVAAAGSAGSGEESQ